MMSEPVTSQSDPACEDGLLPELWISCIEGPVIPEIPGRLIYRNAGNIVAPLDIGCLAAMDMAIRKFDVRRIVVCGHHDCRCIDAKGISGIAGQWLVSAKLKNAALDVANKLDGSSHVRELSEQNVIEQVRSVAGTSVVKRALATGQPIEIVGLIFHTKTKEFVTVIDP